MSGPISKNLVVGTHKGITMDDFVYLEDLEHMSAGDIYKIYKKKINIIATIMNQYLNKIILKSNNKFVYNINKPADGSWFNLRITNRQNQHIIIVYDTACRAGEGAKCFRISLFANNTDNSAGCYGYNSCDDTLHNTIPDDVFNAISDERKEILETFSKKESITILEKIYNYYLKLHDTDYIYDYEKCILILLAAKHKQFCGASYDIAKLIAIRVLK